MTFEFWSLLTLALLAGAMSPGPSLALVVRTSMAYSRSEALVVALAHGAGVGLYALLVVIGLDQVVNRAPWTITALQLAGGMFLIYLGVTMVLAAIAARQNVESPGDTEPLQTAGKPPDYSRHFTNGFLIVFLNPKVIIFFLAIFSQFLVTADTEATKLVAAGLAAVIDAAWYVLVALLVSHPTVATWLQRLRTATDFVFAGFFCLLGLSAFVTAF